MSIEFREMQISDYPNVMGLWQRTENLGFSNADQEENIEKFILRNPGLCFVAIQEKKDYWGSFSWAGWKTWRNISSGSRKASP